MSKPNPLRRLRLGAFLVLLSLAAPALAERLSFDHRTVPALKAVLDSGNTAMIDYNGSNPRYITDVIAVRGRSAKDWDEALVIIARAPSNKVQTAAQWLEELRSDAQRRCNSELKMLEQAEGSILFERHAEKCPGSYPRNAIYLVVQGKTSLFMLAILSRDDLSEQSRSEWLSMLKSAHLE
jgi:hypothetical protein